MPVLHRQVGLTKISKFLWPMTELWRGFGLTSFTVHSPRSKVQSPKSKVQGRPFLFGICPGNLGQIPSSDPLARPIGNPPEIFLKPARSWLFAESSVY